jgi:dolichol-phosphate mannosyltransferase
MPEAKISAPHNSADRNSAHRGSANQNSAAHMSAAQTSATRTSDPEISVIVPAINEAENIPALTEQTAAALKGRTWEMLIVDDASTDDTVAVCARLAEKYPIHLLRRGRLPDGLGGAVLHGFALAKGQYLVVMDADLQHPPAKLPDLLRPLEEHQADFVMGSRYVPGGGTAEAWTLARKINSRVATILAMPFSGPVSDPMSGFFALERSTYARAKRLVPLGYKIGLELMCKCRVEKVREVPIDFGTRTKGQSKLSAKQQFRYLEHLSRLYDFKYPRLSSVLKFLVVTFLGYCVGLGLFACVRLSGFNQAPAAAIAYAGVLLVEIIFHRRYIGTQREFLLTTHPWRDFAVIAVIEWAICAAAAFYVAARLREPTSVEVLGFAFLAATVTRYVLRKELRQDIRGLRRDPREFE